MENYQGHFHYNRASINSFAPDSWGVYYCGYINNQSLLVPCYIGRAAGDGVSIRSRLFDHLNNDRWSDVTHFGYCICGLKSEAESLEASEIKKFQPKYNITLK